MGFNWNVFRIVADLSHFASKCILIWSIHSNRSAEGVSLITQIWYLVVFCARYLPMPLYVDYGNDSAWHKSWNFILKLFYMISSAYIIFIMMRVYARTREREMAWKMGAATMVGSLGLAPFVMMIFMTKAAWSFAQYLWVFSLVLESVAVLPQLLLLRQTTVPTVIDSFYLVTLGSYRGFYILNWIVRGASHESVEPASVIFGVIQTCLYIDFAWVYFTRQRVKLRGGAVVDSDDLNKGWIVKRILGKYTAMDNLDEEATPSSNYNHHAGAGANGGSAAAAPKPRPGNQKWGPRGISVSADDGVLDGDDDLDDPTQFADGIDDDARKSSSNGRGGPAAGLNLGNGSEWRDGSRV